MNNAQKLMTVTGANLLALGMTSVGAANPAPLSLTQESVGGQVQMGEAQLRAIEASHLEVYAGCKWGHAAFDPVKVTDEMLTPMVLSLHEAMG